MKYIDADRLREEIEKVYKSEIQPWLSGVSAASAIYDYVLPLIDSLKQEQKPELVQHPPITYTYPADASKDEQLKRAIIALLSSDLIKVAGKKFTKQDLIDWVEKQKPDKEESGPASRFYNLGI